MAVNTGDNRWATSNFIVAPTIAEGAGYTTIASAITAASAGNTIFIKPGTYTENLTLKAGVNLTAFGCDSSSNATGNVIISGTCTLTAAGSVTISGIQLQTNSAAIVAVTGSAASVVNLRDCYLNCTNNTGITFSSSSASATISIFGCRGNLGTTGIGYFTNTSAGTMEINYSNLANTGASTTASTSSAGGLTLNWSTILAPITTTGTCAFGCIWSYVSTAAQNVISLTLGGSGTHEVIHSEIYSGSASCISNSNTTFVMNCSISSSNTNPLTGAGTVDYSSISFENSGKAINTTTKTGLSTAMGPITFNNGTDYLSSYAEGTFTPTLVGTVVGITTYTAQNGYYVRVGNLVKVQAAVIGTAATGTGNNVFGALPFTVKNQTNGNTMGSMLTANAAGWAWPASTTTVLFDALLNTTTGTAWVSGTGAGGSQIQMANAAFNMQYNVTYQI